MIIYFKNNQGHKLYASASSLLNTEVSGNGTSTLTLTKSDASSAKIRYLTTYVTKKRFRNSIAVEINWVGTTTNARQEVILGVSNKRINSVEWKYGTTIIDENNESGISVPNGGIVTVSVSLGSDGVNHGNISYLSLYGYYVSKQGTVYLGNKQVQTPDSKVGSWNSPGKAYPREERPDTWTGKKYYEKDFDFFPPTDPPNYYIMIAYKGWMAGIGHIDVLEGDNNNYFKDISQYGGYSSSSWNATDRLIRYTFYAVYSDAVIPSIPEDASKAEGIRTGANSRNVADAYAMWVKFTAPPDLYWVYWYKSDRNTFLKDGANKDLKYKRANGTGIRTPDWTVNSFNWDKASQELDYWSKRIGSGSWTNNVGNSVEGTKINGNSLSFALNLKTKKYTIEYTDSNTGATKEYPNIPHGTQITIKPQGNLPQTVVKHIDPSRTLHENVSSYPYNVTSSFILNSPTTTLDWTFVGWSRSGNTFTAVWRPNNINIIYNANNETSQQAFYSVAYGGSHTWKTPSACNFTPPIDKPIFLYWTTNRDGTGERYYPGNSKYIKNNIGSLTVWGQWGSPWKKVEWIWVYEPDKPDGTKDDHGWKRHKPWINTR